MMILSSLSSGTSTPIATSCWLLSAEYKDPPSWTMDTWASKIVFLLGTVHNFWCRTRHNSDETLIEAHKSEWQYLSKQIRRHEAACPITCRPLSAVPQEAFEAVGYATGSAAAAWQMFHTLALVHAICVPSMAPERASTLRSVAPVAAELARKIVANSTTNRSGTAWVNAVQLLTIAGECLVDRRMQKACAQALEDIGQGTGWNTTDCLAVLAQVWETSWGAGRPNAQSEIGELLLRLVHREDRPASMISTWEESVYRDP